MAAPMQQTDSRNVNNKNAEKKSKTCKSRRETAVNIVKLIAEQIFMFHTSDNESALASCVDKSPSKYGWSSDEWPKSDPLLYCNVDYIKILINCCFDIVCDSNFRKLSNCQTQSNIYYVMSCARFPWNQNDIII